MFQLLFCINISAEQPGIQDPPDQHYPTRKRRMIGDPGMPGLDHEGPVGPKALPGPQGPAVVGEHGPQGYSVLQGKHGIATVKHALILICFCLLLFDMFNTIDGFLVC